MRLDHGSNGEVRSKQKVSLVMDEKDILLFVKMVGWCVVHESAFWQRQFICESPSRL